MEILAGFLGHDVKIHREEYYRLPESTTQVAKVGKLLMLMERGEVADFAGKTSDNIEMDLNGNKNLTFQFRSFFFPGLKMGLRNHYYYSI